MARVELLGVIPAAGLSSRIGGSPKPLLETGSGSFLAKVIQALREGGADRLVVGVRHDRGPVAAEARRAGAEVQVLPDLEAGPIATIQAALRHCRSEAGAEGVSGTPMTPLRALILLPSDFPMVRGCTVRRIIETWRKTEASLVLPRQGGRTGHPTLFAGPLLDALLDPTLLEGDRTLLETHRSGAVEVSVEDPGIHAHIDTLSEYRRHFPAVYRKRFQKW